MAATKRQFNWSAVGFTPSGGSLSQASGVTNVTVAGGGSLAKFAGDGDRGNSTVINDFNEPTITVELADEAWAIGLASGTIGSATATHNDAKLASAGAIVFVLNPCAVEATQAGGQFRQFGAGSVNFVGIFSDGTTNPLSFTRA